MGLNIFTIPDVLDKLSGKIKNAGAVLTSEQKTVRNANKRFLRLIGRGDRYVLNGELPNVRSSDVEKVLKMGAQRRDDGTLYVPEGVDLEPFRMYSPMIAEDLDDEHSSYKVTADGLPWENFVTTNDLTQGADSTATSIVYGMIPVLAALTIVLAALPSFWALLAVIPAALVVPHIIALHQGEDVNEAIKMGFIGFIAPVLFSLYAIFVVKTGVSVAALDQASGNGGYSMSILQTLTNFSASPFGILLKIGGAIAFFLSTVWVVFIFGTIVNWGDDSNLGGAVQGGKAWAWGWAKLCAGFGIVMCLPPVMAPWVILLFASAYAMRYTELNFRARGWALDQQNKVVGGVMQDHSFKTTREDRHMQAVNVEKDKSPTIVIAISSGYLASKRYDFSPDPGKKMVVSINDLCTHMLCLGRTGIGKTTNFARLVALQIALCSMEGYRVGLFVLCGKGTLPGELSNVLEWNIKPGMAVGLIEGLSAKELAKAINSMVASSDDKNKIWSHGADNHVLNACIIFEALCQHEETVYKKAVQELTKIDMMIPNLEFNVKQLNSNPATKGSENHLNAVKELQKTRDRLAFYKTEVQRPRQWRWCFDDAVAALILLDDIIVTQASAQGTMGPEMQKWFNFLGVNVAGVDRSPIAIHPELTRQGSSLQKAVTYVAKTWVTMPFEQRQSYRINVNQRIDPLIQSTGLVDENGTPWTALTTGVDITAVMRGARIGIDLPESLHEGAGTAVQILLKQRVYAKLKQRVKVTDWRKEMPEETVFIQIIDECQLLVSQEEIKLLPIARSFGMGAVYLTQNVEGLMSCFETEAGMEGFLDQFQSITCSQASEATYEFVMRKVGHGTLIQYNPSGRGLDFKASTSTYKRSTLNVDDHPQRAFMRKLKRWGFAKVVSQDMFRNDIGHRWDQKWSALRGTNVQEGSSSIRSAMMVHGSGAMQDGPIVTLVEMGRELNTSGGARALVYLNRGNIRRVDFAKTIPVTPGKVDEYMRKFKEDQLEQELFETEAA
ncbi:TPA: hypothetical protein ACGRP4_001379 [Stenotrophomonas maltophilia]